MKKILQVFNDDGTLLRQHQFNEDLKGGWSIMYQQPMLKFLNECPEYSKARVFFYLAFSQSYDELVITSIRNIATDLNISYKSAWTAVKWLEDNDFIIRISKNGYTGFLINPEYSTCGRKSLKNKKKLWKYHHSDQNSFSPEDISKTNSIISEIFGEDKNLNIDTDTGEIFEI